jgi:hypothetical protein
MFDGSQLLFFSFIVYCILFLLCTEFQEDLKLKPILRSVWIEGLPQGWLLSVFARTLS